LSVVPKIKVYPTMKLSRKSDYALRALVTLVRHYKKELVSIRQLAEQNDIPKRFLEQIMLGLREQGWVRGVTGRDGGYELAISPSDLTLGTIVRHFEGVLAPIGCVSVTHCEPCSQEATCTFRRALLDVRNYTAKLIDSISLADLAKAEPVHPSEVHTDV
jgi:Rrf2 family protein